MKHGWNTDKNSGIRVSSVFHPWLKKKGNYVWVSGGLSLRQVHANQPVFAAQEQSFLREHRRGPARMAQ